MSLTQPPSLTVSPETQANAIWSIASSDGSPPWVQGSYDEANANFDPTRHARLLATMPDGRIKIIAPDIPIPWDEKATEATTTPAVTVAAQAEAIDPVPAVQASSGEDSPVGSGIKPDLSEARRLLDAGMHLVKLVDDTKKPKGDGWNLPEARAKSIDPAATGYGLPLELNGLCSVDPDNGPLAVIGMRALGFDLEAIMAAGVRTRSTRTGSGGRATFAAEPDLSWIKFASRDPKIGTVLELRAGAPNLQDAIPGLRYYSKDGDVCTQAYANDKRLDEPPPLPDKWMAWWQRCSTDIDFLNEQQRIFMEAIGATPIQSISTGRKGGKLAYDAPGYRTDFNDAHTVVEILEQHGYGYDKKSRRWYPPTATGAPSVREIAGKDGLWQSDHASDPLCGTFDAWVANVVLNHHGDVEAAKKAFDVETGLDQIDISGILSQMARASKVPQSGDQGAGNTNPPPDTPTILDSRVVDLKRYIAPDTVHSHIVEKWLPEGEVALCAGHGGVGKSYVALLVAVHVALGRPFAGLKVSRRRVLFFSAEDDGDELLRRLARVCRNLGVNQSALDGWLHLLDMSEIDPTLYRPAQNGSRPAEIKLLDNLAQYVHQHEIGLTIIDNASDVFDGKEIERAQVRAFIRGLRQQLARPNRSVLVLAHVSKAAAASRRSGHATDEDYSGSTAWHNTVRSRLTLDQDDNGRIIVKHMKANKSTKAEDVMLEWHDGAPVPAGAADLMPGAQLAAALRMQAQESKDQADKAALLALVKDFNQRGERVSTAKQGPATGYRALQSCRSFPKELTRDRFAALMRDLENDGQIYRVLLDNNRKKVECFACTGVTLKSALNQPIQPLPGAPENPAGGV